MTKDDKQFYSGLALLVVVGLLLTFVNEARAGGYGQGGKTDVNIKIDQRDLSDNSVVHSGGVRARGDILTAEGGQSSSSSNAVGGAATAFGGNIEHGAIQITNTPGAGVTGAPVNLSTGSTSLDAGDTSLVYKTERPASSAAPVYAGPCQRGASGQAMGGGASVLSSDPLCDLYRVADRELLAYQQQWQWCVDGNPACDNEKLVTHLSAYRKALENARNMVENTRYAGYLGRVSDQLVLPAAIIWLLFLL